MNKFFRIICFLIICSIIEARNFYVKVGYDTGSTYPKMDFGIVSKIVKLDSDGNMYPPGNSGGTKVLSYPLKSSGASEGFGLTFDMQVTWNATSDFEYGIGTGYQAHTQRKSIPYSKISEPYKNGGSEVYQDTYNSSTLLPSFDSIPLYLIARYKVSTGGEVSPYFEFDIGYSFNIMNQNGKFEESYFDDSINKTSSYTLENSDLGIEAKDGIYFGFGLGLEYKIYVFDIMYKKNLADYKFQDGIISDSSYSRVTISAGVKLPY
ncbi:MAG: hypothetical protein ACRCSK_07830 [Fusobacteriaceae bacterium]